MEIRKDPPPTRPESTIGPKYRMAREGLDRLDDFPPPRPYLTMPRTPSPERPPPKQQRVTFSGAAMDNDDARWYQDDTIVNSMASSSVDNFGNSVSSSDNMSADVASSIADSVDHPSISNEPHTKKPRLLARYNTEEAVAKDFGSIGE